MSNLPSIQVCKASVKVTESSWDDVFADEFVPIAPVFSRPGCWEYYCRHQGLAWIEENGKAWLYKSRPEGLNSYLQELSKSRLPDLRDCEMEAIRVLWLSGLASRWQFEAYCENLYRAKMRDMFREIRKSFVADGGGE